MEVCVEESRKIIIGTGRGGAAAVTKAPECASALANLPSQMSISGVHDSSDCQHIHENSYRFYDSLLKFTSYKNLKPFVMVFEET